MEFPVFTVQYPTSRRKKKGKTSFSQYPKIQKGISKEREDVPHPTASKMKGGSRINEILRETIQTS